MNRRDFLKSTGALAVVTALPAVPVPGYVKPLLHGGYEWAGEIWCGPVYFQNRYFFVSSPTNVMRWEKVQDPTTWHS